MKMKILALPVLRPASFGQLPPAHKAMERRLAGGSIVSIPIPIRLSLSAAPFHYKSCHAIWSRGRIDPAQ